MSLYVPVVTGGKLCSVTITKPKYFKAQVVNAPKHCVVYLQIVHVLNKYQKYISLFLLGRYALSLDVQEQIDDSNDDK